MIYQEFKAKYHQWLMSEYVQYIGSPVEPAYERYCLAEYQRYLNGEYAEKPSGLWAAFAQGPDEFIAMASREAAEQCVAYFDELDRKNAAHPTFPQVNCILVPWPGTAEEHQAELIERSNHP
ncbi:hypothetical protein GCM10009425_39940 [Pseudomonas asuensis]|uniref:Uncharacterized protein n=2 Tax=Pseudomonas asuensis TaxID=1825787 RepID=A0ABQ2H2A9_9PSED|nr:hypothetical protein GCM10009425_39940 [Pseudomonas asuensis]